MLSLRQLLLIKLSWSQLSNRVENFGEEFYKILFEHAPSARALFNNDISSQEEKFSSMVNFIVSKIQFLDSISEDLRQMGIRHRTYGVLKEHYQLAQKAFVEALQVTSEEAVDQETVDAWNLAITLIINKIEP